MPLCASIINSGFCTIKILSACGFLSIIESFDSLPPVCYKKIEKERKLNIFRFHYNCLFSLCSLHKKCQKPCCDISILQLDFWNPLHRKMITKVIHEFADIHGIMTIECNLYMCITSYFANWKQISSVSV